jgi:O-antigen ligase
MWLLFTVMDIGNPTNQIYIAKWGKCYRDCYYGIYFEIPASTLNIPFYRNTGIYAEAPAFAFNLCIALLIEVYLVENKSAKKTIILIASMLSTVSTTAFLILIYICVTKVWEHLKSKKNVRYIKWILIAIVVVIGMGVLYTLATGRGKAGSLLLRSQDYVNGFNAFLKSPLIGYGYQLDTSVFVTGYSNSISVVLTNGGILLFMIYFMPLIISVFINKNIRKDYMYWYIAVIILLLICAVTYTYLVLTIISAGYATIIRSKYRHEYSFDGSNPQGKLRNKCSRI